MALGIDIDESSTGYIMSPNYPAVYPEDDIMTINISATVGDYLVLWFEVIDLPLPTDHTPGRLYTANDTMDACTDYVQVSHITVSLQLPHL